MATCEPYTRIRLFAVAKRKRRSVFDPLYWTGYEDAQKIRLAEQAMHMLRLAIYLAQKMGARLGPGQILFGTMPAHGQAVAGFFRAT
jgi:hypothetical protein